jgi:hypothetical protein
MSNRLLIKKSSVATKVPVAGDLEYGELAINYTDEKIYFKNASNVIRSFNALSGAGTVTSVAGAGTVSGLTLTGTVTSSGSLTLGGTLAVLPSNFASQTATTVLAAPTLTAGVPTFRTLTLEDIPDAWVKKSVVAATTANITLSAPQTIDGSALVAGNRVLVKNQTLSQENGIYVVAAAAWTRALDADTIGKLAGAHVNVDSGATNGGISFDADLRSTDVLGTTAMAWNRIVDTAYTIPITQGGTGAITAALARTALGAGTVTSVAALTLGTTGTDITSTVATGTAAAVITLNVPTASAANRGALSAADWTTFNSKAAGSHNHTSLTGVTSIVFAAEASDAASISTTITGSSTFFDFNLTDDNSNDEWRWRFTPSGTTVYDAMRLVPVSNTAANLVVSGTVSAGGTTLTGNTGTVTSVTTSGTVSGLTLTDGTITTTGTVTLGGTLAVLPSNFASQTANTVLAAPDGAAGTPTFRNLTLNDLPDAWVKKAVGAATTAALTINTAQVTIDGVTLAASTRVLIKNQAAAGENGIYTGVTTTTWVRALDADTASEIAGAFVNVDAGTVNGGRVFDNDFKSTDTLGTTAMNWSQNVDVGYFTTVGNSFATLANPTAITFLRINADNTVSALAAAAFRTAIGAGTSSTTGTVTSVAALTIGTTGTDITSTVATGTTTPVITLNVPTASASNRGALSAADWTTFNNKQAALGFTPYNATNPSGYITSSASITGNAATSTNASSAIRISFADRRSVVQTPGYFGAGADWSFMANSTDGLSDGGSYHGVMHYQPYTDASGGGAYELGFTDNNNLWLRGSSGALTTFAAWKKIWDSGNLTNLNQLTNGPGYTTTTITATTPIVASASTGAVTLSHAASGATAGTYNNVTVNATGHVTAGSNVAYSTTTGTVTSVATSGGYGGLTLTGGTITTTGTITMGGTPTGTWPISVSGSSTSTPLVSIDNSIAYGRSGLQFVQISGAAGDVATATNAPTADWWHIIRGNHGNAGGYYTDLALPMTAATNIRYRRISNGASSGWITVWDSTNLTNLSQLTNGPGYGTGTVTAVTATTPIVSSGGTTPNITHAASGVSAGTYNNVTVNTFGHVTAGSNVGYISGYTETDTLASVTGRGAATGSAISVASSNSMSMFTGTKGGATYADNLAVFRAVADNSNGSQNTFFEGYVGGTGGTRSFYVRADGYIYGAVAAGLSITGNAATASQVIATVTGTSSIELVRGNMGDNDQFRILVGATASNAGYVEIATADDGNEPIYVRQYTGVFGALTRTAKLLDESGNTSFPGTLTASNLSGTNTGDNAGVTSVTAVTPLVSSGGNTPQISHATSGVSAGTYNNVTVNTFGHVTAGSNVGYISGYTEVDTLATVTARGSQATASITIGSNGTYVAGSIYSDTAWGMIFRAKQASPGNAEFRWATSADAELMRLTTAGNLTVPGTFSALSKSFLIDHPTKPGMQLRYGSLEGPENGVYIRGRLKGNKIELPEYWTKLVDPDSITVNLTAIGKSQDIYIEDIIDNVVYVGGENVNCFYTVYAERVDIAKLEVEIG